MHALHQMYGAVKGQTSCLLEGVLRVAAAAAAAAGVTLLHGG